MDNVGFDVSLPASGDLSAAQYKAVVLTQDGIEVVSTDGPVTGFLQDAPAAANRPGRVRVSGVAFAKAGDAFTQGDYLEVDADGDVVVAGNLASAVAQALETSQGAGARVKVLVFPRPGSVTKVTT
jgi:hypothetical protein